MIAHGLPELALLPTDKDRLRVLKSASREVVPSLHNILLAMCGEILAMAGAYFSLEFLRAYLGLRFPFPLVIAALIGSLSSLFIYLRMFRDPLRRAVRRKLNQEGIPMCVPCGYDLRGSSGSQCPECGAAIAAAQST